jgi:biotin carboxyl carrier protein
MTIKIIISPIRGTVSTLFVAVGDKVAEGDVLCLIEAMKMLTPVESDISGEVASIHVEEKKAVSRGDKLLEIKC